MILCDTSIWIEFFRGKEPIFGIVSDGLAKCDILGLECVFGEVLQGVKGKQERRMVLDCWEALPKFDDVGLWLEAGEYSAIHGLPAKGVGLIDAAIAVATLKSSSLLWTLDKKLVSLLPGRHRFLP
jgi:predicted nucleic acid-binding protein